MKLTGREKLEIELRDAHEASGNGGTFEDWLEDMANNPRGTLQQAAIELRAITKWDKDNHPIISN